MAQNNENPNIENQTPVVNFIKSILVFSHQKTLEPVKRITPYNANQAITSVVTN